jgi:hypothetical protein
MPKKLKRPLPSRSVTAHVQTSIILRHKPINKKQIGKREDVHPIRLERDTNVPKSVII